MGTIFKMGEPIKIIISFKNRMLTLNKEELDNKILNQEELQGLPIAILLIIYNGDHRTEKYFLLNLMQRFLTAVV